MFLSMCDCVNVMGSWCYYQSLLHCCCCIRQFPIVGASAHNRCCFFIDCFLSNLCYDHFIVIFMLRFIKFLKLKVPNYFWIAAGPHISEGVRILQHLLWVFGLGGPNTSKYLDPLGVHLFQRGSKYYSEVHRLGGPNTSKYLDRGEPFWGVHFFRDMPLVG